MGTSSIKRKRNFASKRLMQKITTVLFVMMLVFLGVMNQEVKAQFQTNSSKLSMLTNSQSESMNGNFAISSIYPNPIVNEADFTVNTFEEGTLNVVIYDLSGSFVMNVISDKFMNANSELKVPMTLGLLSSGTYTVTITLNNDILSKQIIIVR